MDSKRDGGPTPEDGKDAALPQAENSDADILSGRGGPLHLLRALARKRYNKANVIERRNLSDLTEGAERAGFCTDEQRDYSDPCSIGDA
jgi:hypothetical protein